MEVGKIQTSPTMQWPMTSPLCLPVGSAYFALKSLVAIIPRCLRREAPHRARKAARQPAIILPFSSSFAHFSGNPNCFCARSCGHDDDRRHDRYCPDDRRPANLRRPQSFPIVAIAFFVMAGLIMEKGGIGRADRGISRRRSSAGSPAAY